MLCCYFKLYPKYPPKDYQQCYPNNLEHCIDFCIGLNQVLCLNGLRTKIIKWDIHQRNLPAGYQPEKVPQRVLMAYRPTICIKGIATNQGSGFCVGLYTKWFIHLWAIKKQKLPQDPFVMSCIQKSTTWDIHQRRLSIQHFHCCGCQWTRSLPKG